MGGLAHRADLEMSKNITASLIGAGLFWIFVAGSMLDGTVPIPVAGLVGVIGLVHLALAGFKRLTEPNNLFMPPTEDE